MKWLREGEALQQGMRARDSNDQEIIFLQMFSNIGDINQGVIHDYQ